MLAIKDVTLICPKNDLESHTILKLAKTIGISDLRVSQQAWGARLENEPEDQFKNLKA